jgi:radical SAM-linked protein
VEEQQRWRIWFGKGSAIKYISHLDLHVAWERALRRAEIPVAYSQGFNPQPKLQLAAALPVGYTSSAEVMDIVIDGETSATALTAKLEPALPPGLCITAMEEVALKGPSLQSSLTEAEYVVTMEALGVSAAEVQRRMTEFLGASRWEQQRQRKGKVETIDLRPLVHTLTAEETSTLGKGVVLRMRVAAGQTANVRAETVLEALALPAMGQHIERTKLLFEFDSK